METPSPKPLAVVPAWIEAHAVVPDGFRKGAPFQLYGYQLQFLGNHYLVRGDAEWDSEQPLLASAFVYRRSLLVGPQKIGKNPLIAAQSAAEGVGPVLFAGWAGKDDGYACSDRGCRCGWEFPYERGDPMGMAWPTPLIQITAFSEESTSNTYDALRPMIELGPLADLIPKTGEEFIRLPGGGRIDTVTSSAQSRLGQRVTFVPQDEVGIWTKTNKMEKVARTQWRGLAGMGGRAVLTTNAWDPSEHSVAQAEYESTAKDVYRQFVQPPKNLSYGNKADRRKIHRAVYPADVLRENGGHVDLDAIEAEAADLVEKDPPEAARFYGNMLVAGSGRAVDPDAWDALRDPRELAPGTYVALGFDGSINQDCTVLVGCTADGYSFLIKAWLRPAGAGPDWSVPRSEVHDEVARAFDRYRIGRMNCDPAKWWTEIEQWQAKYGNDSEDKPRVLGFDTNSARRFAPAVDRWMTAIAEGNHCHDGDPILADHVKAAHLKKVHISGDDTDGRTRYVIVKGEDKRKIDAAVADILAYEAAMTMPPEPVQVAYRYISFDDD